MVLYGGGASSFPANPCKLWSILLTVTLICTTFVPIKASLAWVDPDTPAAAHVTDALSPGDNRPYQLVFSDEFQIPGRTFHDGHDPRWTALEKNDLTNNPLHYYSQDAITTTPNGTLSLAMDYTPRQFTNHDNETEIKNFRGGMLQTWNKFCFMGGILEISAKLPGSPHVGGLWPAVWMMGNLARATYVRSTEGIWPYSTNVCDDRTGLGQQEINSCTSKIGRGAPEVDLFETMYMKSWPHPVLSASLQVAPGIVKHRPVAGHPPNRSQVWYSDIEYGTNTEASLNEYFYGANFWGVHRFQTDAISANMFLGDTHFEKQHTYRLEWEPPSYSGDGYLRWYVDGELVQGIPGESMKVSGTEIPTEPMYLLMNMAISKDWAFPDAYFLNCKYKCYECDNPRCRACALPEGFCENLPASLEIDYVRVYQATNDPNHVLGCSPESRPTAQFIHEHEDRYMTHGQTSPLLPIVKGGGTCRTDNDCGGWRGQGTCLATRSYTCKCSVAWTGPNCLAHAVRDPFSWMRIGLTVGVAVGCILLVSLAAWGFKNTGKKKVNYSKIANGNGEIALLNGHNSNGSSYQRDAPGTNGSYWSDLSTVNEEFDS